MGPLAPLEISISFSMGLLINTLTHKPSHDIRMGQTDQFYGHRARPLATCRKGLYFLYYFVRVRCHLLAARKWHVQEWEQSPRNLNDSSSIPVPTTNVRRQKKSPANDSLITNQSLSNDPRGHCYLLSKTYTSYSHSDGHFDCFQLSQTLPRTTQCLCQGQCDPRCSSHTRAILTAWCGQCGTQNTPGSKIYKYFYRLHCSIITRVKRPAQHSTLVPLFPTHLLIILE